eukprot:5966411-Alexandrium_andersonii.AAC.1
MRFAALHGLAGLRLASPVERRKLVLLAARRWGALHCSPWGLGVLLLQPWPSTLPLASRLGAIGFAAKGPSGRSPFLGVLRTLRQPPL